MLTTTRAIKRRAKRRVSKPQRAFIYSTAKYPAFVGGFGSGKTEALVSRCLRLKILYPNQDCAYYLPTYDLVNRIGFPRFCEKLEELGLEYDLNKQEKTIKIPGKGTIIFRTLDNPEKIVGYQVAHSFVDELDTLKTDLAELCWRKVCERNRQKLPDGALNTVSVGTTPEGFRFVYKRWKKEPKKGYQLIKASTYSNQRNLPEDYIPSLKRDYDPMLVEAYINGEFVNLKSGRVYPTFDRSLNVSNATVEQFDNLFIGMDFNVGQMAAVVCKYQNGKIHAVKEYIGILDTPSMIAEILKDFPLHLYGIRIYPDSSGTNRKTNQASVSDIGLLKQAGFVVKYRKKNPMVTDRVRSVNALIKNSEGVRRFLIADKCTNLRESLEQQAWDEKTGKPDKTSGLDHLLDAVGYFISYEHPIRYKGGARATYGGKIISGRRAA